MCLIFHVLLSVRPQTQFEVRNLLASLFSIDLWSTVPFVYRVPCSLASPKYLHRLIYRMFHSLPQVPWGTHVFVFSPILRSSMIHKRLIKQTDASGIENSEAQTLSISHAVSPVRDIERARAKERVREKERWDGSSLARAMFVWWVT